MSSSASTYDEVLHEIGGFGRWQRSVRDSQSCQIALLDAKQVYFYVCLVSLATALPTVCQSFLIYESRFRCVVDYCDLDGRDSSFEADHNDFTIPHWDEDEDPDDSDDKEEASCRHFKYIGTTGTCTADDFSTSETVACSKHIYDESDYEYSLVSELDTGTCEEEDKDWPLYPVISRNSLLGLAYALGMSIAGITMGTLSDKIGRKYVMILNMFGSFLTMFISSWIANYWSFFFLRIIGGIFSFGFSVAFMISVEIVSVKYRMVLGILINIPFALGEMLVALFSYLLQDWGDNQMAMSFVSLACCFLYFVVPESPRWLLTEGKVKQVKKVFQKGAAVNKKTIPEELLDRVSDISKEDEESEVEQLGFTSLFREWKIASITLIMWFNWVATALSYYGLAFSSVNLSGDVFVSFFLSALIEVPSYVFCALVLDGWGRKSVLMCCQFLAGVCCVLAGTIDNDTMTTVFSLAGKFGASACFAIVYQYTAELYPTQIRTRAVGSSSMAGRVGSVLAPIIVVIEPSSIPLIIMGAAALIGGGLTIFLPETLGMPFPEKIEDIYGLYKNKKKWWKWISRKQLKALQEETKL